jgi:hypothetical protein
MLSKPFLQPAEERNAERLEVALDYQHSLSISLANLTFIGG